MPNSWSKTSWASCSLTRSGVLFDASIFADEPGYAELLIEGPPSKLAILREQAGGHRWQRVPPTERRDRIHTSTVTVAVLEVCERGNTAIPSQELLWETMRGSGAGGQHRNVTESAVRVRHLPTGLVAYSCSQRSQHQNRDVALSVLTSRIQAQRDEARRQGEGQDRKSQVGSGMRGDKIRTYRVRDDVVIDHRTERKLRLKDVRRGLLA